MAKFPLTWVIVADAGRARFFTWEHPEGALNEISDEVNPEGRLHSRDLGSDEPGRAFDSKGHQSGHPMEKTSPHEAAADRFARELAKELAAAGHKHDYEQLVLVAPPAFLGKLRGHLSDQVADKVKATLNRDLTTDTPKGILAHLPDPWRAG